MRHTHTSKNLFTVDSARIRGFQDDETKKITFISYRRTHCDMYMARRCAEVLTNIPGFH